MKLLTISRDHNIIPDHDTRTFNFFRIVLGKWCTLSFFVLKSYRKFGGRLDSSGCTHDRSMGLQQLDIYLFANKQEFMFAIKATRDPTISKLHRKIPSSFYLVVDDSLIYIYKPNI